MKIHSTAPFVSGPVQALDVAIPLGCIGIGALVGSIASHSRFGVGLGAAVGALAGAGIEIGLNFEDSRAGEVKGRVPSPVAHTAIVPVPSHDVPGETSGGGPTGEEKPPAGVGAGQRADTPAGAAKTDGSDAADADAADSSEPGTYDRAKHNLGPQRRPEGTWFEAGFFQAPDDQQWYFRAHDGSQKWVPGLPEDGKRITVEPRLVDKPEPKPAPEPVDTGGTAAIDDGTRSGLRHKHERAAMPRPKGMWFEAGFFKARDDGEWYFRAHSGKQTWVPRLPEGGKRIPMAANFVPAGPRIADNHAVAQIGIGDNVPAR